MSLEDDLRKFRLHAPAPADLRERVLAAARAARREQRAWSLAWAAAAAVVLLCVPINFALDARGAPRPAADAEASLLARELAGDGGGAGPADEALVARLRLALARSPGPRSLEEVSQWRG